MALTPPGGESHFAAMRTLALLLTIAVFAAFPAHASTVAPCSSPEHRQFDFWLGDWQVHTAAGKLAGFNRITREYADCVIRERYATGRGYTGESLNAYDAARKVWHQTWVDDAGLLLTLEGRWNGKSMILEGESPDAKGVMRKQRVTWTPNEDGTVRQLWESVGEDGKWTTQFDGRYSRK
jgi:hypothetical protein